MCVYVYVVGVSKANKTWEMFCKPVAGSVVWRVYFKPPRLSGMLLTRSRPAYEQSKCGKLPRRSGFHAWLVGRQRTAECSAASMPLCHRRIERGVHHVVARPCYHVAIARFHERRRMFGRHCYRDFNVMSWFVVCKSLVAMPSSTLA